MTRRIFLDTEWTALPWSDQSELMWIGLADEDGRSWYGISAQVVTDPGNKPSSSARARGMESSAVQTHSRIQNGLITWPSSSTTKQVPMLLLIPLMAMLREQE